MIKNMLDELLLKLERLKRHLIFPITETEGVLQEFKDDLLTIVPFPLSFAPEDVAPENVITAAKLAKSGRLGSDYPQTDNSFEAFVFRSV